MAMVRPNYDAIRDHLFACIHRNGEQFKNNLPNIIRTAIDTETWRQYSDAEGKPFEGIVDWMQRPFPVGLGMGQDRHALTYEDILQLTKAAPDVHRVLLENAPALDAWRPSKNGDKGLSTVPFLRRGKNRSTSATVLSVRLAQDKPKFYDAFMRGKYRSVTAAAVAAGLLKDDVNMRRAKSAYRKMTGDERKEFHRWIKAAK